MKTIFKYVLLAMAIIHSPLEEEAEASTTDNSEVCVVHRVWVPPGESDKGYPYLGYWMRVRICGLEIQPKISDPKEEKEEKEEQS